ncbi:NAD(P)-binding domain-containing protein [Corynebacterium nuruki]|jgi:cation diffusion facilitator CzcD-associated flavoprotein CzcO|uniref:NAD(P)-binding domain-containing protein n=1 Tax=Corynebacterium nuruki TaxID=1032851 RepID=UPI0039BF5A44
MTTLPDTVPAVIVGAGQAGLAAAHELVRRGFAPGTDILVLDSGNGPGGAWRDRWDSLTLGKAHGIADLPGMPMERPDPTVPASRLVADYYGAYERRFGLAVVRPVRVVRVHSTGPEPDAPLELTVLHDGTCTTVRTRLLLNATGTWTHPYIPYVPGIADFTGRQLHTVDYVRKEDFAGQRVLVVGGGLSAVQFLLELHQPGSAAQTIWATRRPPNFTREEFDQRWGYGVEERVRAATYSGRRPESVVRNTGIPPWPEYLAAVASGVLVSRGMIGRLTADHAVWGEQSAQARRDAAATAPDGSPALAQPDSWDPFPAGHVEEIDTVFWNTGFRPALDHLAPLHLREPEGGGIRMSDEVTVAKDPRVLLVGYGSTASTIGANRAGRLAGREAAQRLAG